MGLFLSKTLMAFTRVTTLNFINVNYLNAINAQESTVVGKSVKYYA